MKITDVKAIVIGVVTSDGSRHEFEIQMVTGSVNNTNFRESVNPKTKKEALNAISPNGDFLTVHEVAKRLRVNQWTVYRWAATGRLQCTRLSKRALRFREPDIEKYINNHRTGRE
jgi:excisionase family DNA binding protein